MRVRVKVKVMVSFRVRGLQTTHASSHVRQCVGQIGFAGNFSTSVLGASDCHQHRKSLRLCLKTAQLCEYVRQ